MFFWSFIDEQQKAEGEKKITIELKEYNLLKRKLKSEV